MIANASAPALALTCRRCGSDVPAGPLAAEAARRRLALDRQCPSCGHRALYALA